MQTGKNAGKNVIDIAGIFCCRVAMAKSNKRGRKRKDFTDPATGLPVIGLSRMTDGRWRIIGTQTRFSEPDPQKAIEQYRKLTEGESEASVYQRIWGRQQLPMTMDQWWAYVAKEIRLRPQWVAKKTGDERLAYLDELKPPEKPPTFGEIESVWKTHYKKSPEQKRRVLRAWADFKKATGVSGVKDITPEMAIAYRDVVYSREITPKMQANLFTRIRRLFTFARSRELTPDTLAKVIDALKRLVPSDTTVSLDPHPIEPDDFRAMLAVADDADRAMLLLMLNGAYYCAEVVRLCWSMMKKGCIVTHRKKEGKCVRVCVLWKETLDALAKLPRKGDHIFIAYTGLPLGTKGAEKRFRTLRAKAKVSSSVTSSHLRDGAATAMVAAGVNDKLLAIAMGHRSGISDHYVKRNPRMVAPACEAVHREYFPESHGGPSSDAVG